MTDTAQTRAQLITAFADNTTGNITAQNMRNFVQSVQLDYMLADGYPQTATITTSSVPISDPSFFGPLPQPPTYNLLRIALVPRGNIYINYGSAASASSTLLPSGGVSIPITLTVANNLYLYASSVSCDLYAFIDRG